MLFSEVFGITKSTEDDWFDPILDTDTPLFVDPFLIFKESDGDWGGAHAQLIAHFDTCFHLIAEGNRNRRSTSYKKALRLLTFPEPREFCLGYTESGTKGAGGGEGYARTIAEAMEAAIDRGLTNLKHFEELGILNEGIGPDRISDVTCNVLRARFINYIKAVVVARHGIPTETVRVPYASYDSGRLAWTAETHDLPRNPYSGKPVLLVPHRFLRHLHVLNPDDWWDFYEGEKLREDVNYEVMRQVNKRSIVEAARNNPQLVREWTALREQQTPTPYDLDGDPQGVYQWDVAARQYVNSHPLSLPPPGDDDAFFAVIDQVITEFKQFIEEQSGWRLLWDDGGYKDKHEGAIQLAFLGIARSYCRANNIVVDREVELGRGPVDFKFSNGYERRALLEVKKLHNGKFWNGLEAQLPSYLRSDECHDGWFVSVQYKNNRTSRNRLRRLPSVVSTVATATGKNLRLRTVDATPKASASTLSPDEPG